MGDAKKKKTDKAREYSFRKLYAPVIPNFSATQYTAGRMR